MIDVLPTIAKAVGLEHIYFELRRGYNLEQPWMELCEWLVQSLGPEINVMNIKVDESTFTVDDAKKSREAFVTSSTAFILPVVSIDGSLIGDGKPGPVFQKLDSEYRNYLSN